MRVHEIKPLFKGVAFVTGVDEFDMVRSYNRLPREQQTGSAREITVRDFDWLLDIFDNDWRIFRFNKEHSFVFSLDFMHIMTPLLKRTDLTEIVLLERFEYADV